MGEKHVNSEVTVSHGKLEKSLGVVVDEYKEHMKEVVRLGEKTVELVRGLGEKQVNSQVIASHGKLEKSFGVVVDEYKKQRNEVVRLGEKSGELVRGLGEKQHQNPSITLCVIMVMQSGNSDLLFPSGLRGMNQSIVLQRELQRVPNFSSTFPQPWLLDSRCVWLPSTMEACVILLLYTCQML